jgi:hypothetical protein
MKQMVNENPSQKGFGCRWLHPTLPHRGPNPKRRSGRIHRDWCRCWALVNLVELLEEEATCTFEREKRASKREKDAPSVSVRVESSFPTVRCLSFYSIFASTAIASSSASTLVTASSNH